MQRTVTIKKKVIEFTNMEATRVGKGTRILRKRAEMSLAQLAERVEISESYLSRLEDGYEPRVQRQTLENIAQNVRVLKRHNRFTNEQLVNIFLCANQELPPKLF